MNALLSKYESAGIVGLGFPCNQFGLQEPGKPTEILNEYKYVRPGGGWTQHAMFKIYNTIEVNGKTAHNVYKHLKAACPAYTEDIGDKTGFFWTDVTARDIVWNYEKFLVDIDGKPRYRFAPSVTFPEIYQYVDELIAEKEAKEATPAPASRQRLVLIQD